MIVEHTEQFSHSKHITFTFSSYNCDKSVFRSIVTCEKEQKLWTDVEFVTIQLWVLFMGLWPWPAKRNSHFRKRQKYKNTFFPMALAKIWNVPSRRKVWLIQSMLFWRTQKNIASMLVYKIYNRFILDCWCEKCWKLVFKRKNRRKKEAQTCW